MSDEEKRPESDDEASAESAQHREEAADSGSTDGSTDGVADSLAEKASDEPVSGDKEVAASSSSSAEEHAPARASAAAASHHDDHGHGDQGHGGHDEHFAHTTPKSLLIGVLVALILLTILTVGVTAIDLGSQGNFIVAMIIATVKAALVMAYFMHMVWDSKFNVVAFTSSFLFVLLFLAMSVTDRREYQPTLNSWEADQKIGASK